MAKLGSDALAAAALATTLCNVTGMSFAVGLSFGLSTLTGQAKGDLMLKGDLIRKRLSRQNETGQSCPTNATKNIDVELEDNMAQKEEKNESDPLLTNMKTNSPYSSYNEEGQQTEKMENVII